MRVRNELLRDGQCSSVACNREPAPVTRQRGCVVASTNTRPPGARPEDHATAVFRLFAKWRPGQTSLGRRRRAICEMARPGRRTLLLLNEAMATAYPDYSESSAAPDLVRLFREQPHPQDLLTAHYPEPVGARRALQVVSRVPHR